MQTPTYPVTPLRQIAIILAHCIVRIPNKRSADLTCAGESDPITFALPTPEPASGSPVDP